MLVPVRAATAQEYPAMLQSLNICILTPSHAVLSWLAAGTLDFVEMFAKTHCVDLIV
jgi:hypothetical protein